MRKIEQAMRDAAFNLCNWKDSNTEVRVCIDNETGLPFSRVFLHGNHIADVKQVRHDAMQVIPNETTFCYWPTMTTASRLRALGVAASIKNGKACIN
jgi:hypothetical protein